MLSSSLRLARPSLAARVALPCARVSALSVLSLATLATAAQAQSTTNQLDQVVVTATRMPQRLGDVLTDVTVITRAEIERQAFGGLADLLVNAGCVEVARNGGPSATTSLFLRGADSRHTVLLIDGVRVDSQSTGGAAWNSISLAQIERVEVLKGPASAVYGSDAIGGVIQVFTRRSDGPLMADLGLAAGTQGTVKLEAAVRGGNKTFDHAASVSVERSSGFNATNEKSQFSYVPDSDGYRRANGSLRLGAEVSSGHRLSLVALKNRTDSQYDGSRSKPLVDDHAITNTTAARLAWDAQWSRELRTELSLGEGRDAYETRPSVYQTETRIRSLALNGSYQLGGWHQLNALVEHRENRLDNTGLRGGSPSSSGTQTGLALGHLARWTPALQTQLHVRADDDSEFGVANTGTAAVGYALTPSLRLMGSVGTAFRAPTLYQRGSVYGPDLSKPGVSALKPERGQNFELGLRYSQEALSLSATAYRNRISDLIVFGQAGACSSEFGCYENVARARLQGLHVEAQYGLGDWLLSGSVDAQSPKDVDSGKLLARRSKLFGTLRAQTKLGAFTLGGGVQTSGQRYDNASNTTPLGGYAIVNLDAQYALQRDLKLSLNLDNAFNRVYQVANGYNPAPRSVMLGLRWTPSL
ncbi:TonB-dependent receptor plug domain-containing protein [Ideonella sp.]|jgi:vitamin B12 transporter|uniref:TonB-dependent receptor plug domain-containing protein n=1 Tax=Ideonella sp. TaxID=1929293 RepID=UPI0037BF7D36